MPAALPPNIAQVAMSSSETKYELIPASGERPLKALAMAAEAGDAEAQFELGYRYLIGLGIARDERRAYTLWRKAAGKSHIACLNNLGCLHGNGSSATPVDDKAALSYFQKAAVLENVVAQLNLGRMYMNGRGTSKNLVKARLWIKLAAQHGSEEAQALLKDERIEAARSPLPGIAAWAAALLVWSVVYLAFLATPLSHALAQFSDVPRFALQVAPLGLPFLLLLVHTWRKLA